MKQSILVLFLFSSFVTISFAQKTSEKVDVKWGNPFKSSKRSSLSDIIGHDETGIYTLKQSTKPSENTIITIEHYDSQMNFDRSAKIELNVNNSLKKVVAIKQLDDKILFFYSKTDVKNQKNELYVDHLDKRKLDLSGASIKLGEIDVSREKLGFSKTNLKLGMIDLSNIRRMHQGLFNVNFSSDDSKILVYYNIPDGSNENAKLGMIVYDVQFNKIWKKEESIPYKDFLFHVKRYKISNHGNVFIAGRLYKDKAESEKKGKANYNYHILRYSQREDLQEYPIAMEGTFFSDLQFDINPNEDLICGGFYSTTGDNQNLKGSFYLKIDGKTKKLTSKSLHEFDIDFITQNFTEKQKKKVKKREEKGKDAELIKYKLNDIVLRSDGGIFLIGEQYYTQEYYNNTTDANGFSTTYTTTHYFYNDILVVNISPEGKIDWTEKIAKRQVSINDGGFYSSYTLSLIHDKLYFIFNDNPKNHFTNTNDKIAEVNFKEAIVSMVELDVDGRMTKEALFSTNDTDVITRPKVCEQISDDVVIIFGQRKKQQQFAKVKFK